MPCARTETCRRCDRPRAPSSEMVLCAEHLREYNREANRRSEGVGFRHPDARRLRVYLREAVRQGATEDESWWIAMAAEKAYSEGASRPRWLTPFVQTELRWLRDNAPLLQHLRRLAF